MDLLFKLQFRDGFCVFNSAVFQAGGLSVHATEVRPYVREFLEINQMIWHHDWLNEGQRFEHYIRFSRKSDAALFLAGFGGMSRPGRIIYELRTTLVGVLGLGSILAICYVLIAMSR